MFYQQSDGHSILFFWGLLGFVLSFIGLILIIIYLDQKKRHRRNAALAIAKRNEELLKIKFETQEQILTHLSIEFHDNLGALASLIKINLLTVPLNEKEKARKKLDETTDLARQLIVELKALSVNLNSDCIARKGLYPSFATDIGRIKKTEQFNANLKLGENLPTIENNTAIILYRMVQETLNNMVKHSEAKNITLDVQFENNVLNIVLMDDGVGFNVEDKIKNGEGSGLYNFQKRAVMINANTTIESSPLQGTRIVIALPIN